MSDAKYGAREADSLGQVLRFRTLMVALLLAAGIGSVAQTLIQKPDVDFTRGIEDLKQQNWQGAISSFRNSLKVRPHRAAPLFYLSQAYYLNGQLELALTTIAEVARLEPKNAVAKQKYGEYLCEAGKCLKGLTLLLEARHLEPGLERIDFDVGMANYRMSHLDKAIQNLEVALTREPSNAVAAFFLAECYSLKPDWPRAEMIYRRALAGGKQDAGTYYGLGVALLRQGDTVSALPLFEKALATDPSLMECRFQIARALRTLGRNQEAEQQMKLFQAMHEATDVPATVIVTDEPDQEAFWAGCQRLLEQGKERQALERLRSVNGGQHPYYLLGALYYSIGHFSDAQRVLNISIKKEPKDADALAWLGRTEMAEGHFAEAEASFRHALEIDPENRIGMAGIGAVGHAQQRWSDSAEWIERSRTRDPATLLDLCDDYLKLGRRKDAELTAELVRSFGAGDKTIQSALDKLLAPNINH